MSESLDASAANADTTVAQVIDTIAKTTSDVRAAIFTERGDNDSVNPTGDEQLAADLRADELFEQRLLAIDGVASYASEEREAVVDSTGRLHLAVDPLDGSSNLEPNSGMGTIFTVYSERPPTSGRNLVAAGFVVYGPVTSMLVARDGRVREYLLNDGERRLVDNDVTVPDDPTVFGFGGGVDSWTDEFEHVAESIREELKLRYGGAMVADINQVLTYGGVFAYPALESRPEGKLRLQFEGHPMAYIVESAGGSSSNGDGSLLDAESDELHGRTPLYLGNDALIDRIEASVER
jgi:fructose-1,6-bisphosphatase I